MAKYEEIKQGTIFPEGVLNPYGEFFVGDTYLTNLVTAGEGWYQEEGQPAQSLKAGDTIVTKDGVKHWHGAKKDSWFEHIAITAGTPEWLEPVSDEIYDTL